MINEIFIFIKLEIMLIVIISRVLREWIKLIFGEVLKGWIFELFFNLFII